MSETATKYAYAAFGETKNGDWVRIRMERGNQKEAEHDILAITAWYEEIAEQYVGFKVMKRKVTTTYDGWVDATEE